METILVTGGCGYIGSHICLGLIENGYKVIIIDSFINSSKKIFEVIKQILNSKGYSKKERISLFEGDLRDSKGLDKLFNKYKKANQPIKAVIHLAGLKSTYLSFLSPLRYWDLNVLSTISLLKIMKKYDCFSLIFSSSASVYKQNGSKLLKENDPLAPKTPYGKTKLAIETILDDLYKSEKFDWRIINLRYFNPVGAHKSRLLSDNPKGEASNLFPAIMKVIKKENEQLLIYGNDWPTKDGTCVRDFIHIMDLADAHIASLNYLLNNDPQNTTLNIGTGIGTSILEVVKEFNKTCNQDISFEFTERRSGDLSYIVADNSLALKLLQWNPSRTLSQMCEDTLL